MMRTDFESTQYFEVSGPDDSYHETECVVGVACTAQGYPSSFDPRFGGDPGAGPEFDVVNVTFDVTRVNYKGDVTSTDTLTLDYWQFRAVVGEEVCEKVIDAAFQDAADSGDFG
jgi:hypothetical protein